MSNLYNQNIGINYKGILNLDTTINTPLDATLRAVTDGMGNNSPFQLSTLQVGILSVIARASGTNTDNPFLLAYTINNSGGTNTVTGFKLNATETAIVGTTHNLMDLQVGGVSKFLVSRTGAFTSSNGVIANVLIDGNIYPTSSNGSFSMFSDGSGNGQVTIYGNTNPTVALRNNILLGPASLIYLKGTTSSFPAIKRNGAAIDFRLADDSGYCNITVAAITTTAASTIPTIKASYLNDLTNAVSAIQILTTSGNINLFTSSLFAASGTINASARVQIDSTTQGFLMPRMTYAQMKAISSPATGLQVYNTTDNTPQVYDGIGYQILGTSVVTGTISAGATTLSCDNGNIFALTLVNGTPTAITLSNARPTSIIINLKQPAGGSATVTWATTIVWAGGSAPTLTTTANYSDIITLIYDGITWRGTATLNFAI